MMDVFCIPIRFLRIVQQAIRVYFVKTGRKCSQEVDISCVFFESFYFFFFGKKMAVVLQPVGLSKGVKCNQQPNEYESKACLHKKVTGFGFLSIATTIVTIYK